MRLPIVAGPLRGRWWLPASRGKVLRVLGGTYEPEQTSLFVEQVRRGATVLDVGANAGYYTLLAATLAGPGGRVIAFEPEPGIARFLRRHVAMNRLGNVRVEEAAVSERDGTARFATGTGSGTGRLAGDRAGGRAGGREVRTVRLDTLCAADGVAPDVIKVDVEGAELDALRGARETLERHRPVVFLSTHGAGVHAACLAFLRGLGYTMDAILGDDVESTTELLCLPGGAER